MNKKATVILLSASLAFFIASVIFMNTIKTPSVLGETQLNISGLSKEGDVYLAYIDNAAKFALAETIKHAPLGSQEFYTLCKGNNPVCNDISQYFGTNFKKHLDSFNKAYDQNLDMKNYKFSSKLITLDNKPAIEIIGVSTDQIIIRKGEDLTYLINPNFKIRVDLEELNSLATTTETIAITFFNELVNKFEKCLRQSNSGLNNCFCDNSEIDTKNLPEDYKVSIITVVEREKLFGGVEYQFKLLDKKGNIILRDRGQPISSTLKGVFGAYEYMNKDIGDNVCYPGALARDRTYTFDSLNPVKGRLYLFSGEANCKGISKFSMVEFVKRSDFEKLNKPSCSEIGIKPQAAEEKEWKISAYFDGDSEVDQAAVWSLNELETIGSNQVVDIYAQIDRWESEDGLVSEELNIDSKFGTRRYYISKDDDMIKINSKEVSEFGTEERNMGIYKTFKDFVEWVESYSSKKSIFTFKGHGYGIMMPIEQISSSESENDKIDNDLPVYTISKVFNEALKKKPDIIIFDSCEKATIETAYQLRNHAKVLVASEEVMQYVFGSKGMVQWSGIEYDKILDYITKNPKIDAEGLGKFIVESYFQSIRNEPVMEKKSATLSAINLENIEGFVEQFSKFSNILVKSLEDENTRSETVNVLKTSLKETQGYNTPDPLGLYTHIDLFDFLKKVYAHSNDEELKKAIESLKKEDIILNSDYKGQDVQNSNGIAMLFIENFDNLHYKYSPSYAEELSKQVMDYYSKSEFAQKTGWDKVMGIYQKYSKV